MKRHIDSAIRACVIVLSFLSLITAAPISFSLNDDNIKAAIEEDLRLDEAVPAHLVDVKTENGIVTLSGSVGHILAKDSAVAITESIKGVRSVINNIEVNPVKRSDRAIRNDIKDAFLLDPAADSYEIQPRVKHGIVTLTGKVDSWTEKQMAAQVAKSVKGARAVINDIGFKIKTDRSDHEMEADIQRRNAADPYLLDDLIDVKVINGKAVLSGKVGSAAQVKLAERNAWVAGIHDVDSAELTVEPWIGNDLKRGKKWADRSDLDIKQSIQDALVHDPRVQASNINVKVRDGFVNLRGDVSYLKAKLSAGQDAKNTRGVVAVTNDIRVIQPQDVDSFTIEKSVETTLLWDPILERHDISLVSRNNTAFLYGTVDTQFEKWHAARVTSGIDGVAKVENNLKVRYPWKNRTDYEIEENINRQLFWSFFVESDEINVSVNNGIATLTGKADSWKEVSAAIQNAYEGGARQVESFLHLEDEPLEEDPYYGYFDYRYEWN